MTNSDDRLNRLENQAIDLRVAVSAMLETVVPHQRNFDRVQLEIRDLRQDMLQIQAEVRGLQTENRRILDILEVLDILQERPDLPMLLRSVLLQFYACAEL